MRGSDPMDTMQIPGKAATDPAVRKEYYARYGIELT